jgi:hypothetical protein
MHKALVALGGSLVILTLLLGLPAAEGTRAASQPSPLPANWIKGVNMIGYAPDPYKIANQRDAIASWKATGANAIAFAPRWFMDSPASTTLAPDASLGSPSDESVIAAIDEAHRQGLRVMLRPYLDVKDGSWRADITPSNVGAWFASYTAFIGHYLDMAKAHNVEEFTLGVELINMTQPQYDSYWSTLIDNARARFPGLLTYSANWGKSTRVEYTQITWWGKLDYIGLSAYFPLYEPDNPSLEQLVAGWSSYTDHWGQTYKWIETIKGVRDRFNKDVVFTEIGYGSYINSPARWDQPQKTNVLDLGVQERAVEATLRAWSTIPWFRGIYWWHWEPYVGGGGPNDPSDALNNKPAVQVLTRWYGGSGQPPAPSTPAPQLTPQTTPAPGGACTGRLFPETGKCVNEPFLSYWLAHGQLPINGYPISDEFTETLEDGKAYRVQYFERVRMEHHPENAPPYDVLLGQFGRRIHPADPPAQPIPGARFFGETGHNLRGGFLQYWSANGGLAQFGYPITEEITETLEDGKTYTVQYFERARFEHHPQNSPPYDILLGQFGRRILGNR